MIKPDENLIDYVDDYVHGLLSPEDAELVERYCQKSPVGKVALEEARKRYAAIQDEMIRAVTAFAADVRARAFPGPEHVYGIAPQELAELRQWLVRTKPGPGTS